jgi:CelD/BcsL family acetyltransferase involved in cellulose biosynthesis
LTPVTEARPALSCDVVSDAAVAESLAPEWAALQGRADRNELTQSPDWLLAWWRVYGASQGRRLRLGLFRDGGRLVGLAPLLRRRHWYRCLPFRRLELLASGEPAEHGIYSNHLGVLAERGAEEAVAGRLVRAVADGAFGSWDEVMLPMMSGDTPLPALLVESFRTAGYRADLTETARAPYIPLPATWDDYLRGLSANGRRNVQRSLKAFDAWSGSTTRLESVTGAADLDRGKEILVQLHQARWASDNETGVFRSPFYLQFHDDVMRRLAGRGSLELHWLSARGEPVAVLYGMEWAGKVSAYQTGRRTDVPANLRPGAVVLALAIRRAIEAGRREFDLQADEVPYKMQFASQSRPLVQVRAARATLVEGLRRAARWCVRRLRSVTSKSSPQA